MRIWEIISESVEQDVAEGEVVPLGKKHRGDLEGTHECVKCGGDLQSGTYMGHKVKVCQPCKQVYLPPNSGIDQQGNKINEQGLAEAELDEAKKRKRKAKSKRRSSSPNRSPVPRFYGAWGFGGEGEGDGGGE